MFAIALALFAVAPQAPVAAPSPVADPKAKTCRKVKATTGSRLGTRRECRSGAEWAELDRIDERDLDAMRRRSSRQTW